MRSSSICFCTWLFIHAQEINGHDCSKLQRWVRHISWWFWSLCHPPPDVVVQSTSFFLLPLVFVRGTHRVPCFAVLCIALLFLTPVCIDPSLGPDVDSEGSKLAGTIRFRLIGWVPFQKGFVASYSQLKAIVSAETSQPTSPGNNDATTMFP